MISSELSPMVRIGFYADTKYESRVSLIHILNNLVKKNVRILLPEINLPKSKFLIVDTIEEFPESLIPANLRSYVYTISTRNWMEDTNIGRGLLSQIKSVIRNKKMKNFTLVFYDLDALHHYTKNYLRFLEEILVELKSAKIHTLIFSPIRRNKLKVPYFQVYQNLDVVQFPQIISL